MPVSFGIYHIAFQQISCKSSRNDQVVLWLLVVSTKFEVHLLKLIEIKSKLNKLKHLIEINNFRKRYHAAGGFYFHVDWNFAHPYISNKSPSLCSDHNSLLEYPCPF